MKIILPFCLFASLFINTLQYYETERLKEERDRIKRDFEDYKMFEKNDKMITDIGKLIIEVEEQGRRVERLRKVCRHLR